MLKKLNILPFFIGLTCGTSLVFAALFYNHVDTGYGKITNAGFETITVTTQSGEPLKELIKDEFIKLPYGVYQVEIPMFNKSFPVFKNNNGNISVDLYEDTLVFETDTNASFNGP
ncbi:hypothetical protein [Rubritalea sp.]|uniref:hypothetical protein n=1 Tax=Rubritalea sp. TaxID=2109375 RepID=UPI003EFB1E17